MTPDPRTTVLCVDLGKTSCRAVLLGPDGQSESATLSGVAGAADGGSSAAERILATIARLPAEGLQTATACGVGAAGILTNPTAGRLIAERLRADLGLPTAVASDVVTAHLGAFGGEIGVILVAGTGAVAVAFATGGELRRIDGWGPDLGDLGSGSWIGREGVRAALGAASGLRVPTALTARLDAFTPAADAVRWVSEAGSPAQRLASFAPAVLDEAEQGDAVALGIADAAIGLLRDTASAAASGTPDAPPPPVAVLGGLTHHRWFGARLRVALNAAGMTVIEPLGTAIDGARSAATNSTFPHERHIHRA